MNSACGLRRVCVCVCADRTQGGTYANSSCNRGRRLAYTLMHTPVAFSAQWSSAQLARGALVSQLLSSWAVFGLEYSGRCFWGAWSAFWDDLLSLRARNRVLLRNNAGRMPCRYISAYTVALLGDAERTVWMQQKSAAALVRGGGFEATCL